MNHAVDIALFIHVLSLTVWVGGMFFAHFCLRPAMSDLSPQLRLPLWEGVLGRFFVWVSVAILLILLSGGFLMSRFGGAQAPWPIHAMTGLGVVMMLIFGHIRFGLYPKLRRAVQAQKWPEGAKAIGGIRRLVTVNLVLGIVTILLGVLGRT
ncbi:MAG: CopD family protein [Janthinobacterium lividum]